MRSTTTIKVLFLSQMSSVLFSYIFIFNFFSYFKFLIIRIWSEIYFLIRGYERWWKHGNKLIKSIYITFRKKDTNIWTAIILFIFHTVYEEVCFVYNILCFVLTVKMFCFYTFYLFFFPSLLCCDCERNPCLSAKDQYSIGYPLSTLYIVNLLIKNVKVCFCKQSNLRLLLT